MTTDSSASERTALEPVITQATTFAPNTTRPTPNETTAARLRHFELARALQKAVRSDSLLARLDDQTYAVLTAELAPGAAEPFAARIAAAAGGGTTLAIARHTGEVKAEALVARAEAALEEATETDALVISPA